MKQFEVNMGNITTLEVDVIVNAASRSLRGGGVVRVLRPLTTTQSASVKWALNRNYAHFAWCIVCAHK